MREEALIDMMPREVVVADAIYDEMRIQDSKIPITVTNCSGS